MLGGLLEEMNGGDFGHGMLSAGLSKGMGIGIYKLDVGEPLKIVLQGIAGGVVAEASGGDFANGAASFALQFAFNQVLSSSGGNTADQTLRFDHESKQFMAGDRVVSCPAPMGCWGMTIPQTPEQRANGEAVLGQLALMTPIGRGIAVTARIFSGLRTAEAGIATAINSNAAAKIAGGYLSSTPANSKLRIWIWDRLAPQISAKFPNWSSTRLPSTSGTLFSGEAGEALLILRSGAAYRGNAFNSSQFISNSNGSFTPIVSKLTKL
jgi:hypothetical protein